MARADERAGFRGQGPPVPACSCRNRDPLLHDPASARAPGPPFAGGGQLADTVPWKLQDQLTVVVDRKVLPRILSPTERPKPVPVVTSATSSSDSSIRLQALAASTRARYGASCSRVPSHFPRLMRRHTRSGCSRSVRVFVRGSPTASLEMRRSWQTRRSSNTLVSIKNPTVAGSHGLCETLEERARQIAASDDDVKGVS
jgi:hypothetical protein